MAIDPRSGYCPSTKTFHSLRPPTSLPPPTLPVSFAAHALSRLPSPLPALPALLDSTTGEAISFPTFLSSVRAVAASLRADLGVSRGDVVFVLAPNSIHVPVLYYALLSLGAVVSPANPVLTAAEVSHLVALSNPSIAVAVSATASKLPSGLPTVLLDSARFRALLRHDDGGGKVEVEETVVVQQSDTAAILYSSGTTGPMKAVALPHRSLIADLAASQFRQQLPPPRRVLLIAPMSHALGFVSSLITPAIGATSVVMTAAGFHGVMEAMERFRVTDLTVAPPVIAAMARGEAAAAGFDVSSLQMVLCGAAPLPHGAAVGFREKFPGVLLAMGYGSTEAGAVSSMVGPGECSRLGSVGRLNYGIEAKIVQHVNNMPLSTNQIGELCLSGPFVMKGYVRDDKANSAAFDSGGWLKTGDLCYIDQDGFVFIVDRLKELIKYKGYQVAPAELEQLLHTLPGIKEAVVIPYPDDELGELPTALVVREQASNITENYIKDYVAKKVAPYKKIRKVIFVNSIPKSPTGKVARRELSKSVICGSLSKL